MTEQASRTSAPCPEPGCSGVIITCRLPNRFSASGLAIIAGKCAECEARAEASAEEFHREGLRLTYATECGCTRPEVWPEFVDNIAKAIRKADEAERGVIWALGGVMSGKTTLCEAFVHGFIDRGTEAYYLDALTLLRLGQMDAAPLIAKARAVPVLALDGLAQTGAPLQPWEASRIAEVLSGRANRLTLVTSPLDPSRHVEMTRILGPDLAERAIKMTTKGIRLTS